MHFLLRKYLIDINGYYQILKGWFLIFVDMTDLNTGFNCISLECGKTPIFVKQHDCNAPLHPLCNTITLGKTASSFMYIIECTKSCTWVYIEFTCICSNYITFILIVWLCWLIMINHLKLLLYMYVRICACLSASLFLTRFWNLFGI